MNVSHFAGNMSTMQHMETTPDPSAIGQRLSDLRNAAGWKREDVAEALTIHWRTVQNWERGLSIPWPYLTQLADLYNVSIRWILWGDEYMDEIQEAVNRGIASALENLREQDKN